MKKSKNEGATNAPGVSKQTTQDSNVNQQSPEVKSGADLQKIFKKIATDSSNFSGLDSKEATIINAIIQLILTKSSKGSTAPTLTAIDNILKQKTKSIKTDKPIISTDSTEKTEIKEEETNQLKTYGDLKKLVKSISSGQTKNSVLSKAKDVAIDQLIGLIPGGSNIKSIADLVMAARGKPDGKKTDTFLDKLDINDQTAAIVDDTVENSFFNAVAKEIEKEPDDKKLEPDYSMDAKLANWLKANYKDHFVAPEKNVQEELNEGEFCPQCLAEYIEKHWNLITEAEYKGRKVQLGKPFLTPDGPKKRSVYVKNAKGNVVKVNFGQKGVKIKKNIPARRKSFRARHGCDKNPGPRWKAKYWSCKFW